MFQRPKMDEETLNVGQYSAWVHLLYSEIGQIPHLRIHAN